MAGTTTNRGYPYPQPSDDFTPSADIQALAEDVDTDAEALDGRIAVLEQLASWKSLCALEQQTAQSIPYNTATALTFGSGSERHDSHNFHSTSSNPSRITPNIPGWYHLYANAILVAPGSTAQYDRIDVTIYKNGAEVAPRGRNDGVDTNNTSASNDVSNWIDADGIDDYFEAYVEFQTTTGSGAQNTAATASFRCFFACEFVRPA